MEKNVTKIKIALAQINLIPADIEYNKNKIIKNIKEALLQDIGLILFPNLALYGYCKYNLLKKFPYVVSQIAKSTNLSISCRVSSYFSYWISAE